MQARALGALSQTAPNKRLAVIEPGFPALLENVATLRADTEALIAAGRHRSARIIDGLAQEEAAKVLLLLDMVRFGLQDDVGVRDHVNAFYSHLSRLVVAEVATYRPASFGEIREAVDGLRRSHHLDGPNDFDWVFRNQLESSREEAMYVDYVNTDDGPMWLAPGRYELQMHDPSRVTDLVLALGRVGAASPDGLRLVEQEWKGVRYADGDHWTLNRKRNVTTVQTLQAAGLASAATARDLQLVIEDWPFPTGQLSLKIVKVELSALRAEQERAAEAMARDWAGY